ncbi:hypothetical protein JW826_03145 [Candidatus Woesearchaeota archaeon]|nr:hypothetical protein [Candidatus Woesearchaeota archaeon]
MGTTPVLALRKYCVIRLGDDNRHGLELQIIRAESIDDAAMGVWPPACRDSPLYVLPIPSRMDAWDEDRVHDRSELLLRNLGLGGLARAYSQAPVMYETAYKRAPIRALTSSGNP